MSLAAEPDAWAALVTLITIEIVLGIDNLIFISILTNTLPEQQRARARRLGLGLALILRLALLSMVAWVMQLIEPVFSVLGNPFSWRDLILITGGLFLAWKGAIEILHRVNPVADQHARAPAVKRKLAPVLGQILALDVVFSLDSIITAVGMTEHLAIMMVAVVSTVVVMLFAAAPLAGFIRKHPTVLMLAFGFLLLIGASLIADGFGVHIPKGYIYAALAFSAGVEALNILSRRGMRSKHARPVRTHRAFGNIGVLKVGASPQRRL